MRIHRPPRARSFGTVADSYDERRPSYPRAAIDWALGPRPLRVADLGAGTGILSRALAQAGHQVIAVEPDPRMLDRLRRADSSAVGLLGTAEHIPLSGGSVDAVVAGQAHHWFDTERAHPQIVRVLKHRGRFAVLWNVHDDREPWVAELSRIIGHQASEVLADWPGPETVPHFAERERAVFDHAVTMTPETLLALARSHSAHLTAAPEQQAEMDRELRELMHRHPVLAGRAEFPLPYRTAVYRMRAASG